MTDVIQPEPPADAPSDAPEGGGPPWIDPEFQQRVEWRDGDIAISVPFKSGTTWTMNIVHQLRTGGDPDFEDIYVEVPWIEFLERPGQRPEELLARWKAMPATERRAFKSHAAPPMLPFVEAGAGPDVKYVVILRNPEEAAVSLKPFIERHSDAHYERWQVPREALVRPDFATYYDEVFEGMGFGEMIFGFMAGWWPRRHDANVLMLHFSELKREPEGSIRRIADFLGFAPTPAQWPKILEYCSFTWMKAHQRKFEVTRLTDVPVLDSGAMIRKGQVGAAAEDGMTESIAARLRAQGAAIVEDPRALQWHYQGGPLPPA